MRLAGRGQRALLRTRAPQSIKRRARAVTVAYGQATAGRRVAPGWLIVGAQRGGTTALFRYLSEHPDVVAPLFHKGVHYFDVAYDRGPRWYRGHFPTAAQAADGRRALPAAVTGEASPYYMYHPLAPERIGRDLPGAKLIVLLREPVSRAISHHAHEVNRGFEELGLAEALEAESARLAGVEEQLRADPYTRNRAHQHWSYRSRGEYATQIERLWAAVPRGQVLILASEELFGDPAAAFSQVVAFLGLREWEPAHFARHNHEPAAPTPPEVLATLGLHYRAHNERLFGLLGRALPWTPPS